MLWDEIWNNLRKFAQHYQQLNSKDYGNVN